MPQHTTQPALDYSLTDLAEFFTKSFANYFVPVAVNATALAGFLRRDDVDLALSRVLLAGDQPAGLALIARRGWTSRVAAMGIFESNRGQGAGKYLLQVLTDEARARGDHTMVLEVIEQNINAIRLYEKFGFIKLRRLVGLSLANSNQTSTSPLEEIDIRAVVPLITQHGLIDLPWQLSGESLATFSPPARAFKLDSAYAVISNPETEHISIAALIVETPARHRGRAAHLIEALLATYPNKTWHVPAIYPEEIIGPFEKIGFTREAISQFQMNLTLK